MANRAVAENLLANKAIQRLAGYASSCFSTWAPKLFQYYQDHLNPLFIHSPNLKRNFPNSIFPGCTFNFGPQTVCVPHRDFANLAFGLCSITSLGKYDYLSGGHLILWELGIIIEFPPGSTILIPSACLTHSNTKIQTHEIRMSITQYAAGGLFRWVRYGFRKEEDFKRDKDSWDKELEERKHRWAIGLDLFSTLDDLRQSSVSA